MSAPSIVWCEQHGDLPHLERPTCQHPHAVDSIQRAAFEDVEQIRVEREIEEGRADEAGDFLIEYLADFGPEGVRGLAQRVLARREEG